MAFFRVHSPEGYTRDVLLNRDQFSMGREADNALVLEGGMASRHHARVLRTPEGWVLEDLGSSNGTLVQGVRISRHALRHGDSIQLGDRTLLFFEGDPSVPPDIQSTAPILAQSPALPPPLPAAPSPAPLPPAYYQPQSLAPSTPFQQAAPASNSTSVPVKTSRLGLILALTGGLVAVLGGLTVAGFLLFPRLKGSLSGQSAATGTAAAAPAPEATASGQAASIPPVEMDVDMEVAVDRVVDGFRTGDLQVVLPLSLPARRDEFRRAFEGSYERMQQAATLLSSRRLHSRSGDLAQFTVVDEQGQNGSATFQKVGTTWLLSSLPLPTAP